MTGSDIPIGAVLAEIFSLPAQPAKREATDTDSVLVEMLTENTGAHILDSGGAYGRNFERNQKRDLANEPEITADWSVYPSENATWEGAQDQTPELDLTFTLSVFHFLSERLDYEPELDRWFAAFADTRDGYWPEIIEEFFEKLNVRTGADVVNTYNGEDALSQVLQFGVAAYPDLDSCESNELGYGDQLIVLQIHGGCDVRGGYTEPRVFRSGDFALWDNAHADMSCDRSGDPPLNPEQLNIDGESVGAQDCNARWYTDDQCHWYDDERQNRLEDYPCERGTVGKVGTVVVNEDANEAFCPVCGRGKLKLYAPICSG